MLLFKKEEVWPGDLKFYTHGAVYTILKWVSFSVVVWQELGIHTHTHTSGIERTEAGRGGKKKKKKKKKKMIEGKCKTKKKM